MPRLARLLAPLSVLALVGALVAPATAQVPNPLDDRIVPEPLARLTYLGFDEYRDLLDDLAAAYPGLVDIGSMGDSEEGRPLLTVELTDPTSDVAYDDRGVVFLSMGIHANEPGGREGAIRVVEDLLVAHAAGDARTAELLDELRIVFAITNSDSWVSGDLLSGGLPSYGRGNANGVDLNRTLPWPGRVGSGAARDFTQHAESRAMVADAERRRAAGERVVGVGDVHGMVQDEAAVWTLLSSGQFDLSGWVRQRAIGEAIDREVRAELATSIGVLEAITGGAVAPHRLTSSSEFKGGLSGSGFYGDWLAQRENLDSPSVSTIELFFNNGPSGTYNQGTFVAPVVQIHVDSVRAIVRGILDQALLEHVVRLEPAGPVGVVVDPRVVAVPDTPERRTAEDTVTPMRFFDDLDPFLPAPARRLTAAQLAAPGALDGLGVLVVPSDAAIGSDAAMQAVRTFAEAGGEVVLTDAGLAALPRIDGRIAADEVSRALTSIGNASFVDFDHPLARGVRDGDLEAALHTYEPSTLGYHTEGPSQAPVWRVARSAFEAAGGTTVATTGAGQTSIGELPLGDGVVRVIGGLLPFPTLENAPRYGLASYAPNDTGTFVFANALGGDLVVDAVPARDPEGEPTPTPTEPAPTPTEPEPTPTEPGPTPTEPGPTPPGDDVDEDRITRVRGTGRVETAIAASAERHDTADTVVIARAGDYPDALAGAPLAAALDAPLLLSDGAGLSDAVAAEIQRLGAGEAILLGGTAALSEQVEADLALRDVAVDRIDGANRFATAAAIARRLGPDAETAFVAAGGPAPDAPNPDAAGWPDALAAAPYAAFRGAPILLVNRDDVPAETAEVLAELGVEEAVVVGGTGVVGQAVADRLAGDGHGPRRLAGATRYATSRAVADEAAAQGMAVDRLWLATGRAFPDALGAGPVAGALGEVLLLVDGVDLDGSPETAALLQTDTARVRLIGGAAAISERVEAQVRDRLGER
jgi:putative cell wall-binding protein